jgi:hypothetical protein
MDAALLNYKKTIIEQYKQQWNSLLFSLKKQLIDNINKINKLNISSNLKIKQINYLITIYNASVSKINLDFTNKINYINSLSYNKYGLLIGINYNNTQNQLLGCINDTNNIKNILQEQFGYNNFNFLTDLTETKPTKKNIINSLTNLLVSSRKGDSLFFLYSGHGTCTIDLNNDETDGQDEMIVPLDAVSISTCISDDELNKIVKTNLKEGVKLFMLFDSCFSGTVMDLKYNFGEDINKPNINTKVSETIGQVIMISGCKDSQTSADASVNYNGQNIYSGAMTFSFIQTIQDLGTKISFKTLLENMRKILGENGYSQIPQLSSGTLIDINNIYVNF